MEHLAERCAGLCGCGQNEQAVLRAARSECRGQAEFVRTAQHPLALDATQLADLDHKIRRKLGTRERDGHLVADAVIFCTAHDLPLRAAAVVHFADAQTIRIRMLRGFLDFADDDVCDGAAGGLDALDFHARHREEIHECRHGRREFDEFTEPVERDFHRKLNRGGRGERGGFLFGGWFRFGEIIGHAFDAVLEQTHVEIDQVAKLALGKNEVV